MFILCDCELKFEIWREWVFGYFESCGVDCCVVNEFDEKDVSCLFSGYDGCDCDIDY